MLCYADAYVDRTIKNSYIILTETGSIVVKHDCYFRHFTPFPSLLNAEVENRHPSTFVGEIPVDYDDMFIDLRTYNDVTNGNHLQSARSDAGYDQQLGQAEHGSIPFQSSLLRNPWFLKDVTARLQRNDDEASSDDESFVSLQRCHSLIPVWQKYIKRISRTQIRLSRASLDPNLDHLTSMSLSKARR
jgi:hypothetical protein